MCATYRKSVLVIVVVVRDGYLSEECELVHLLQNERQYEQYNPIDIINGKAYS